MIWFDSVLGHEKFLTLLRVLDSTTHRTSISPERTPRLSVLVFSTANPTIAGLCLLSVRIITNRGCLENFKCHMQYPSHQLMVPVSGWIFMQAKTT